MSPVKIFESADRAEAHVHLAAVIAAGTFPLAECREDPNAPAPYQVWSGPEPK